jgi:hypothetical protein
MSGSIGTLPARSMRVVGLIERARTAVDVTGIGMVRGMTMIST